MMVLFDAGLISVGVALLLAPVLAEYAKMRHKADKGFAWLAVAGVVLLFSGTFAAAPSALIEAVTAATWDLIASIFGAIGWLLALIGTIFIAYEILLEK